MVQRHINASLIVQERIPLQAVAADAKLRSGLVLGKFLILEFLDLNGYVVMERPHEPVDVEAVPLRYVNDGHDERQIRVVLADK